MSKLRSLNTVIWSDTWFEILNPEAKLLFIYFVTNEKTNMLGVYEISIRKVSFETGISTKNIETYLKQFESEGKIRYSLNRVLLLNFVKHQNYNFNMMKSAIRTYNELPNELKCVNINTLEETKEGFETLCNGFSGVRKIEVEYELEVETEYEEETEDVVVEIYPTFDDFWDLYDKKTGKEKCIAKWNKLKQQEKELIIDYIPNYILSKPEKQYRKDPLTFLNNKSWNDELIFNEKTIKDEQQQQSIEQLAELGRQRNKRQARINR